ncbi:MAG: WG repeat-containing protein [Bacteroidales bacterium]|nr:WG repeat-containing protein [Bacteroidales bacterium]
MRIFSLLAIAISVVSIVSCTNKTTSNDQLSSGDQPSFNEDIVEINQQFIDSVHQYDELFPFSEGLAAVRKGEQFGYINTKGELVIPCKYTYAGPFNEGLACVTEGEDKSICFVDKNGMLHQTNYPFGGHYYLGWQIKRLANGYIDSEIISFKDGICEIEYASDDDNPEMTTVYLNKQLKEVSAPEQKKEIAPIPNEYEIFSEPNKDIYGDDIELKGLKDKTGKILIPAEYNNLRLSDNGIIIATLFIESAESHLRPYIPYGLQIDGYIDLIGNSTFTETDYGKIEGYKAAQLPIYNNAKLKEQEEQARLEAEQESQAYAEKAKEHERQLRSESAKGPQWIDGMWRYEGYVSTRMGSLYINSALKIDRDRQTLVWVDGSDVMESGKYEVYDGSIHCNSSYWELDEVNHRIGIGNGNYFYKK